MSFFEDKTAIVTGGVSGIGYATVEHFLKQNIRNIAILDLADPQNVTEALQSAYANQNVVFIKTDVTNKDQVKSAFDEVVSKFNFVDFVVANAGVLRENDYELTINVNLLGVCHTIYTAIDVMKKENGRGGTIVSLSSVVGLDGYYATPVYSATKHGIIGLNRCLGTDHYLNKYGIKFLTICPGFTKTSIFGDMESQLPEGTLDKAVQVKEASPFQTADSVGLRITQMIISDRNGSVWIVDGGKKKEVTLKKYFSVAGNVSFSEKCYYSGKLLFLVAICLAAIEVIRNIINMKSM